MPPVRPVLLSVVNESADRRFEALLMVMRGVCVVAWVAAGLDGPDLSHLDVFDRQRFSLRHQLQPQSAVKQPMHLEEEDIG